MGENSQIKSSIFHRAEGVEPEYLRKGEEREKETDGLDQNAQKILIEMDKLIEHKNDDVEVPEFLAPRETDEKPI
jgi:hypothetical protein